LITGAAGGLGKALVEMAVSIPDIDKVVATDINEEITGMYAEHERVVSFVMNATSDGSIDNVKTELQQRNIVVKYLINNAGMFMFHPVSEMTEELINRVFRVNALSSVLMVRHFVDDLKRAQGRVIQISSCAVKLPTMFQSYPASKIALEALSISMRQELSLLGIKLVMIRSGAINTDLIKNVKLTGPADKSKFQPYYRKFVESAKKDIGKTIAPERVAEVVKKAATVSKPKYVYTINRNRTVVVFSLFPQKIIDYLIRKTVGG